MVRLQRAIKLQNLSEVWITAGLPKGPQFDLPYRVGRHLIAFTVHGTSLTALCVEKTTNPDNGSAASSISSSEQTDQPWHVHLLITQPICSTPMNDAADEQVPVYYYACRAKPPILQYLGPICACITRQPETTTYDLYVRPTVRPMPLGWQRDNKQTCGSRTINTAAIKRLPLNFASARFQLRLSIGRHFGPWPPILTQLVNGL